jgi:hypothetical protein
MVMMLQKQRHSNACEHKKKQAKVGQAGRR